MKQNAILKELRTHNESVYLHSLRVGELCYKLAKIWNETCDAALQVREEQAYIVGSLHDVGKIFVENAILDKRGPLTSKEWEKMRMHPYYSYAICRSGCRLEKELCDAVLYHHIDYNGAGYPGIERISQDSTLGIYVQMIRVSDSFDAMTSERSYQRKITPEVALWDLYEYAGEKYSLRMLNTLKELIAIQSEKAV